MIWTESQGEETLTYTFDGQDREIDLSGKNAEKFRKQSYRSTWTRAAR